VLERLSRVVPRGKRATLFEDRREVAFYRICGCKISDLAAVGGDTGISGTIWSRKRGLVVDAGAIARGTEDERTEFRWLVPTVGAGPIERGQSLGEWFGISPLCPVGSK
jgi:hypothetical protein